MRSWRRQPPTTREAETIAAIVQLRTQVADLQTQMSAQAAFTNSLNELVQVLVETGTKMESQDSEARMRALEARVLKLERQLEYTLKTVIGDLQERLMQVVNDKYPSKK